MTAVEDKSKLLDVVTRIISNIEADIEFLKRETVGQAPIEKLAASLESLKKETAANAKEIEKIGEQATSSSNEEVKAELDKLMKDVQKLSADVASARAQSLQNAKEGQ